MTKLCLTYLAACASLLAQHVVHYELKMRELKTVYGDLPPVMHVKPGDIIDTTTVDADGKEPEAKGYKVAGPNPLTGPFYIDGAEPGDTLAVKFISIETNAKEGFGSACPGFGALNSSGYTPVLGGPIPKSEWPYLIDKAANVATFKAKDSNFSVKIPLHPFLGCVGVAPGNGEARSSIVPAEFGGNMDAPEASAGNTLYLPVSVAGALLSFGDWPRRYGRRRSGWHRHRNINEGEAASQRHQEQEDRLAALRKRRIHHGRRHLPPARRRPPHRLHRTYSLDAHQLWSLGNGLLRTPFQSRRNPPR